MAVHDWIHNAFSDIPTIVFLQVRFDLLENHFDVAALFAACRNCFCCPGLVVGQECQFLAGYRVNKNYPAQVFGLCLGVFRAYEPYILVCLEP